MKSLVLFSAAALLGTTVLAAEPVKTETHATTTTTAETAAPATKHGHKKVHHAKTVKTETKTDVAPAK